MAVQKTKNKKTFLDKSIWYALALTFVAGFYVLVQASHDGERAYWNGEYKEAFLKLNREADAGDPRADYLLGLQLLAWKRA